jgi:hypothetical protein
MVDLPEGRLTDPQEIGEAVREVTNLTADQLRTVRDSPINEAYLSEQAQPGNEPIDDTIRLLETPVSEYRDVDDGFNEVEQGRELLNYHARVQAGIESSGLGSNFIDPQETVTRQEHASTRWGVDPDDVFEY